jgi:hypothetical protein
MASLVRSVPQTLSGLRQHPQDHGWRAFFEAVDILVQYKSEPLHRILSVSINARPNASASLIITLLGASIKRVTDSHPQLATLLESPGLLREDPTTLESIIVQYEDMILETLLTRQNSFTGTRRFLVPQTIFSRYFARQATDSINFLDVGTGLGILPRQLNSPDAFDRFSAGLEWPFGIAPYRPLPLAKRYGIDKPPLPDLDWVHHCYGPSSYYDRLFNELLWILELPEVAQSKASMIALDALDAEKLGAFIRDRHIRAAHCGFVLYQYEQATRDAVIASIVENLAQPGLLISMEPRGDLTQQGCHIRLFQAGRLDAVRFAVATDSHLVGRILPDQDYEEFISEYL